MPKKLGTCPKALEARERKAENKKLEREKKEKEISDAYWKDDDKQGDKKKNRKEERDEKRQTQLQKKKEAQELFEAEMNYVKSTKKAGSTPNKVTRSQISFAKLIESTNSSKTKKDDESSQLQDNVLEPNVNRVEVDGAEARNVTDAISILKLNDSIPAGDRHPERRLKAAYSAYEEAMIPQIRAENPNLRLTQIKQIIFKNFQIAPENPKNQATLSYDSK